MYQNIYSIGSERSKYVFILSGDHIYKMNYANMLKQHVDSGADVTVATIQIPVEAGGPAVRRDRSRTRTGASSASKKNPPHPKQSPHQAGHCNASMGIYIFNTHLMIPILLADSEDPKSHHDFGKDILPRIISKHRVFAYNFVDENQQGLRCTGAMSERSMPTTKPTWTWSAFRRFSTCTTTAWPLRTWQHQYPPAKFVFADPDRMGVALDSIVAGGSIISGGRVIEVHRRLRRAREQLFRSVATPSSTTT